MNSVEQLQFRLELNKLQCYSDLDEAFSDKEFVDKFTDFVQTRIGTIWMKGERSKLYKEWNK